MVVTSASLDDLDRRYRNSVVLKLERMVCDMQHSETGVTFRAQKLFLTSIPAAVSGSDLIQWISKYLHMSESVEASHVANMLCCYGYVYPIAEGAASRTLVVKDDPTALYRFQAPYFWLSTVSRPDAMDYAIYLVKRSLRGREKLGLEEYEQEALQKLQKLLCDKWEFIHLQAEEQVRLCRERKKGDKIVLDDQERAFWRIHRPPPGATYHVEEGLQTNFAPSQVEQRKAKARKDRRKGLAEGGEVCAILNPTLAAKAADNLIQYYNNHKRFDWWCGGGAGGEVANVWLLDPNAGETAAPATLHITTDANASEPFDLPSAHEVKLWASDFDKLLGAVSGIALLRQFLLKEFSTENLSFWLAVREYRYGPSSKIKAAADHLYDEFLKPGAPFEINIDSKTMSMTERNLKEPDRFAFDEATDHIYNLMKKDSYTRFLRSEDYNQALQAAVERQQTRMKSSGLGSWLPWQQARRSKAPHDQKSTLAKKRSSMENLDSAVTPRPATAEAGRSSVSQSVADLRAAEEGEAQSARLQVVSASPVNNRPSTSTAKPSNVVAPWEEEEATD